MPVELSLLGLLWAMTAAEPRVNPPATTPADTEVSLDLLEYLAGPDAAPAWLQEEEPPVSPPKTDSRRPKELSP